MAQKSYILLGIKVESKLKIKKTGNTEIGIETGKWNYSCDLHELEGTSQGSEERSHTKKPIWVSRENIPK